MRRAFSLLELLIVAAIISALVAILLPSLASAREQSRVGICLSNCRSINTAMISYVAENATLPWFYVHGIEDGLYQAYPGSTEISSFSWGGMLPPVSPGTYDSQVIPDELRPFNRWIAPDARFTDYIGAYVCPSDSSATSPGIMSLAATPETKTGSSNWKVFGTSFSINWHWVRNRLDSETDTPEQFYLRQLYKHGGRMLRDSSPANLIWNSENHLDQLFNPARPDQLGIQGRGWHDKWSTHTAMYFDGHATHEFIDTRFQYGPTWTISPKDPRSK